MKNQCSVDATAGPVRFAARVWSPKVKNEVTRLPGCDVIKLVVCPCARKIVTATIPFSATFRFTGSETICAPLGTEMLDSPLNVSVWRVEGSMVEVPTVPFTGSATVAAVIGSFVPPNTFVKRTRNCEPGRDILNVCRIVLLKNTRPLSLNGGGGRFADSVSCGIVAHELSHTPVAGCVARRPACAAKAVAKSAGAARR